MKKPILLMLLMLLASPAFAGRNAVAKKLTDKLCPGAIWHLVAMESFNSADDSWTVAIDTGSFKVSKDKIVAGSSTLGFPVAWTNEDGTIRCLLPH